MIYLDTSVLLAHLLAEDHAPSPSLWSKRLVASRLLEYETWTRIHALGLTRTHGVVTREALQRVSFVEMSPLVFARAVEPFPVAVRTLDALHLAAAEFLRGQGIDVQLATHDVRLQAAARAVGLPLHEM